MDETQRGVMTAVAVAMVQGGGVRGHCPEVSNEDYARAVKELGNLGLLHTGRIRPEPTQEGWQWIQSSSTPGLPTSDAIA
ncbi:MAG: hypothetical protein OXH52_16175 [Gammaproteobacteria bacterium]|nr:hypothetical protein [Gammaproteobacteria bacterium]